MTQNRYYSNTATVTTLANLGGIDSTETDIVCGATTNFPGTFPFVLRMEPDTNSEEAILITSGAGTSITPYQGTRGYDGTAQRIHAAGVQIKHGFVQLDFAEPQQHLSLTGSASAAHGLPASAWTGGALALISDQLLASNVTSITFGSIPQTYKHLWIMSQVKSAGAGASETENLSMTFNGITSNYVANYSKTVGSSATVNTSQDSNASNWSAPMRTTNSSARTSSASANTLWIPNYASASYAKTFISESFTGDDQSTSYAQYSGAGINYNASSSASGITTITFTCPNNLGVGSRFSLYALG